MVEELHLEGTELELYALIYGFTENGDIAKSNGCFLSLESMGRRLGKQPNTICYAIRKLQDKNLILRIDIDGQKVPCYKAIRPDASQESLFQADIALPAPKQTVKRFVKPTFPEVVQFMSQNKIVTFTPHEFYAFYEANGWMVGKNKMKDWQAAIISWNNRRMSESRRKAEEERKKINALRENTDKAYAECYDELMAAREDSRRRLQEVINNQ